MCSGERAGSGRRSVLSGKRNHQYPSVGLVWISFFQSSFRGWGYRPGQDGIEYAAPRTANECQLHDRQRLHLPHSRKDDDHVFHTYRFHSGLFVSGSFQFDLWPFDDVTLIKGISRTEEERKSKLIFSGFSPGVFGGGGIYHDFKSGNNSVRVSLGFEYGYYDYYYGYRHGTIDGQDLSKYVNKDKYSYRIAFL